MSASKKSCCKKAVALSQNVSASWPDNFIGDTFLSCPFTRLQGPPVTKCLLKHECVVHLSSSMTFQVEKSGSRKQAQSALCGPLFKNKKCPTHKIQADGKMSLWFASQNEILFEPNICLRYNIFDLISSLDLRITYTLCNVDSFSFHPSRGIF